MTIFVFNLNGDVENPNKIPAFKYLLILAFHRPRPDFTLMSMMTNWQLSVKDNRRNKNRACSRTPYTYYPMP